MTVNTLEMNGRMTGKKVAPKTMLCSVKYSESVKLEEHLPSTAHKEQGDEGGVDILFGG